MDYRRAATVAIAAMMCFVGIADFVLLPHATIAGFPIRLPDASPAARASHAGVVPPTNPGFNENVSVEINTSAGLVWSNYSDIQDNLSDLYGNTSAAKPPQGPGPNHSHYYIGEQFSGASRTSAYLVEFDVQIPNDYPIPANPGPGDLFYEVISAYDNVGNYMQIGVASFGNVSGFGNNWGVVWAALPNCGTGVGAIQGTNWNLNTAVLDPGSQYHFEMYYNTTTGNTIYSVFEILGSIRPLVYTHQFHAGGTNFVLASHVSCGGFNNWPDYTIYQECWNTSQQNVPNWDFWATGVYPYIAVGSYSLYLAGSYPSGLQANIWSGGPDITILNEYFTLNLTSYWYYPFAGRTFPFSGIVLNQQTTYCTGTACHISSLYARTIPSGWGISFSTTQGNPSFAFSGTVTVPSNAACGYHLIRLEAYSSALTQFTTVAMNIFVGCGGGGGCVLTGTLFSTPSGPVEVQSLSVGSTVYGYNTTTSTLVSESVRAVNHSIVPLVLSINSGELVVTPTEQPIYVQNATYVGWLRDPQNLSMGEAIFDPLTLSWIVVNNATLIYGNVTVYDVSPSTPTHNYIGNGVLIMSKRNAGGNV